jgi:hypothetical protein
VTTHRAPASQVVGRDAGMGPGRGVQVGGRGLQDLVATNPTKVQPATAFDELVGDADGARMVPDDDVRLVGADPAAADIGIHQG